MTVHSAGELLGRTVLVVHESAFQRSYLADVLAGSGATVVEPVGSFAEGATLLDADPAPWALVLSPALPDGDGLAMARVARNRGVAILPLGAQPNDPEWVRQADRVLPANYAGFQVAEALIQLLTRPPARRVHPGGLQRRGR